VVITDHPDPSILNNLHKSVDANRALLRPEVDVKVVGYEWGANPEPILALYVPPRLTLGLGGMLYGSKLVTLDLLMVGASTSSSSPTSCTSPLHTLRCCGALRRFSHKYLLRVCTSQQGSIPNLLIASASYARQRARAWRGQTFKGAKRWKGRNLIHPSHGVDPCKLEGGRKTSWR
jgi:hypothetical protein